MGAPYLVFMAKCKTNLTWIIRGVIINLQSKLYIVECREGSV